MTKKLTILLILLLGVMTAFSQKLNPELIKAMPSHPRILLFSGEEKAIHQTIASSETWKQVNQSILSWSDSLLVRKPIERVLTGKRLLGPARECLLRICYLSYAYRITNNEKYLKRAEQEMLAVSAFSDWNPSHFLDVAEFTMALSIGYDWLYNRLPESSRVTIRAAILEKGLKPSLNKQYNGWLKNKNNWNQVCNAGMTYGALAIFEDEPDFSRQIIERAIQSITLPMDEYNPDGAYNEGYGYWGYGTSFNVMFLAAIEKAFKTDFGLLNNKGFFRTPDYLNNMLGTTGLPFNYSDCASGLELHPAMIWFAKHLKDNSLLWEEKQIIEKQIQTKFKFFPMFLIWGAGINLNQVQAPQEKMWVGKGKNPVALMRTSWTDPNAIFVGIKGGTCQAGHSHMDAGTFVMDADGVRWAMDFGPQDYNSLESQGVDLWNNKQNSQRWEVFRYNNFVHNTLTVNNEFQLVDGYAPMLGHSSDEKFMNATFNLSEVYKGQLAKVSRGIAIINQNYVQVQDELTAPDKTTTVRWTMLTPAKVTLIDKHTAELTKDGKKLILKVKEPEEISLKTWTTTPAHSYDAPNPGTTLLGFEYSVPAKSSKRLLVLLIPEKANKNLKAKNLPLSEWNKNQFK